MKRHLPRLLARGRILRARTWYVDIPRTGSTSLKTDLAAVYGPIFAKSHRDWAASPSPIEDHRTAQEMERFLSATGWRSLFTFTFVRNPWSRMLSLFRYRRDAERSLPHDLDFNEYARKLARPRYTYPDPHSPFAARQFYYSCCDYLCDKEGKIIVSFVGKFETRAEGLAQISEKLGLKLSGDRHLLKTGAEEEGYRQHYEPRTAEIVGDHFHDDVRRFGYAF